MLTPEQIQKSLHKLFVTQQIQILPLDEQCPQWKVRFQYIQIQRFCWHCKKWDYKTNLTYCGQCGADYYSHIDLKNNQIAPIKHGRCKSCLLKKAQVYGSLNGKLQCQICYYENKDPKKAKEKQTLFLESIQEIKNSQEMKQLQQFSKKQKKYGKIKLILSFGCMNLPQEKINQMIQPWMLEWEKNPNIPIDIKNNLKSKVVQKQKEVYKRNGVTY